MNATMPALVGGLGPDWELRDVDVPTPRAGQVVVRVRAAGLNRADLGMLLGTYNPGGARRDTFTAGLELAGEVDAIGDGVDGIAVGDRVMGTTVGAFAPFALADARLLLPVPDSMAWSDAASLPVALNTEHDALVTQGGFTAGQRVLVVGATSGVGMIAVQLATALGAGLVIGTTRTAEKVDAVRSAGADLVVDTMQDDLVATVLDATDGKGVDIVLDHVGGELFASLLACTRIQGTIVNIGRLGGRKTTIDLDQLAFRRIRAQGTTFSVRTAEERAEVAARLVPDVLPLIADGRIRPIVDSVYALADGLDALARLRSNEATGKIVLEMPT